MKRRTVKSITRIVLLSWMALIGANAAQVCIDALAGTPGAQPAVSNLAGARGAAEHPGEHCRTALDAAASCDTNAAWDHAPSLASAPFFDFRALLRMPHSTAVPYGPVAPASRPVYLVVHRFLL